MGGLTSDRIAAGVPALGGRKVTRTFGAGVRENSSGYGVKLLAGKHQRRLRLSYTVHRKGGVARRHKEGTKPWTLLRRLQKKERRPDPGRLFLWAGIRSNLDR